MSTQRITDIPNVYNGSSIGVINTVSDKLIGMRVIQFEEIGTVHFIGSLANSSAIWLGIDWDNGNRGRHNGSFKGVEYFKATSVTSGSFVKPNKLSLGTSIEEALVTRYSICTECQILIRNAPFFQPGGDPSSGVQLEFGNTTGQLKATLNSLKVSNDSEYIDSDPQTSDRSLTIEIYTNSSGDPDSHKQCGASGAKKCLPKLKTASVPGIPVFRCLHEDEEVVLWPSGERLQSMLPKLTELDLSNSLLSSWMDVAKICCQLPNLLVLNVSKNRIRLPIPLKNAVDCPNDLVNRLKYDVDVNPEEAELICSSAFPKLERFVAVGMPILTWTCLTRILPWMPNLKEICVAYSPLGNIPSPSTPEGIILSRIFVKLEELDLTSAEITDFEEIRDSIGLSECIKNLILNGNHITSISLPNLTSDSASSTYFPQLTSLFLRGNNITDWCSVNELLKLPLLENLVLTDNPILLSTGRETARQEIIARLPKLKSLNRLDIMQDERRGAELDYLKHHGKVWAETEDNSIERDKFHQLHPSFETICEKYGPPEPGESKPIVQSLKEGLLQLKLTCEPNPPNLSVASSINRRLPSRMTINHVKTFLRRAFHLPARAQLDLFTLFTRPGYKEAEIALEFDTRELGYYSITDGDQIIVRWHE